MLRHTIKAVIQSGEQSGYVAECLEIAVVTQGRTLDEVAQTCGRPSLFTSMARISGALAFAASPTVVVTLELQPTHA